MRKVIGETPTDLIKKVIINACLVIAGCIFALMFLEIGLRFTPYANFLQDPREFRYAFKADSELGYDIQENFPPTRTHIETVPYQLFSNNLGCMDDPYVESSSYILLVGDSFTHAWAPYEHKWGTIIERITSQRVLKCGVTGYGTKQEYLKAKRIIEKTNKEPKLIIVGYYLNDLQDDYTFPQKTVIEGGLFDKRMLVDAFTGRISEKSDAEINDAIKNFDSFSTKIHYWAGSHSVLYSIYQKISVRQKRSVSFDIAFIPVDKASYLKKAWKEHLENIRKLKDLAYIHNSQLLVVIIPSKEQVYPFLFNAGDATINIEQPQQILRQYLETEHIDFIDLLQKFRYYADKRPRQFLDSDKDLYWKSDGHWSIKGNHLAGYLVAEHVLKNYLQDDPNIERKMLLIKDKLKSFSN